MRLTEQQARARLAAHDHGVLCTTHPIRGADAVPVVYVVSAAPHTNPDGGGSAAAAPDRYLCVPVDTVKPKASRPLQRERNLWRDDRATLLVEHWDRADWSRLWWARAALRWQAHVDAAWADAFAALLAAVFPQYRDRPFARLLVFRIAGVTGWAAAMDVPAC